MELTPRQNQILDIVRESGSTTAADLAERLDVSSQTIRREIAFLHDARLLARYHGGVSHMENGVRTSFEHRQVENLALKEGMAETAAEHVSPGATVYLDTGTTIGELARVLSRKGPLRVFTCNVLTAAVLVDRRDIDLYIAGGHVAGSEGNVIGRDVIEQMEQLRFDIAFVGFSAFDDDGTPMDFDVDHAPVKRRVIANARKVIALADHTKFDRRATLRSVEPEQLDLLITSAEPPEAVRDAMARAGVSVEIVPRAERIETAV